MGTLLGPDNALAWSQFRLKGGPRNLLGVLAIYIAIIGGLILISTRVDPTSAPQALATWTMILLGLQIGILLLLAPSVIRNAVRKDIDTGMIESHRLMPMTGVTAVVGYVTGPSAQAVSLFLATFCLGLGTAATGGYRVVDWVAVNVVLALFAACVWVVFVLLSMLGKNALGVMLGVLFLIAISGESFANLLPGVTILAGPVLGGSIFGIVAGGSSVSSIHLLSFCLQLAVAGLCFLAAARRYCRNDVPAFGRLLGMALVIAWVLASICGMSSGLGSTALSRMWAAETKGYRMVASILAGTIVAFVPLAAAVLAEDRWRRRRALDDPALEPHPIAPVLIALVASAILLLLPLAMASLKPDESSFKDSAMIRVAIFVTVTGLLQVRYLLGVLYRFRLVPTYWLGLWVVLNWGGPPLLDLMWAASEQGHEIRETLLLWTWSPVGLLLASLDANHTNWVSGPLVQTLATAALAAAYHGTRRFKR